MEAKIITRGKGHSAVAAAAYRTGTKIRDTIMGKIHDYSSRTKGVVESVILRPDQSPEWSAHTDTLWNKVEASERRKDSQLAREFVLAVPKELSKEQQFELATEWAKKELVAKGMVAEVSLHHPKGNRNPHVHILATMRTIEGNAFSAKKPREWNDKALLVHWRESWCEAENAALEKAGRPERVDHRSLLAQGSDRIPEPKIGKEAMGMKERGVVEDPERFKLVRKIRAFNELLPWTRAMKKHGEIKQIGVGPRFWDRGMIFMAKLQEKATGAVKKSWAKLLDSQRSNRDKNGPKMTR